MRALLIACLCLSAAPAFADETAGTVLAYDRVAKIVVLDDKTIWPVGEATEVTADLVAGDKVKIIYVGGGDAGVASITSILRSDG